MDVSAATQNQIESVRQALGTMTLQKSMNQDEATVSKLVEGMEETSQEIQKYAGENRGNNVNFYA